MKYPYSVQKLIDAFSTLPTVGPKTAERYVLYLLKKSPEDLRQFGLALSSLKDKIKICGSCLSISETSPCAICADARRNKATVCVVADTRDMLALENTGQYSGLYHILGGVINIIEGIKPEQLNIGPLAKRIKTENIKEIILALNPDFEGETTAMYLAKLLKTGGVKITRLAKGLPMGADLEYADEITLTNALKYRNEL